jgi:hypothetical protein
VRATQTDEFNQMMQLAMQESSQTAGLQGNLAQADLTRDLAINAATQKSESDILKAETAAAAMVPVTQSWMAPGTATEVALTQMGYTPDVVANLDNTTLRGLVNDFWDEQRSDLEFDRGHVQTRLPWDQRTYYNYPDEGMGEFRQGSAFEQQLGMDPEGAGMGLQDYAASLGFQPWQDPISYTNAQFASGDYPGSRGFQPEPLPWRPSSPQGVAFDVGFIGPGGPVVTDINALKQYAASVGITYPDASTAQTDPEAISRWYTAVLEASLQKAP